MTETVTDTAIDVTRQLADFSVAPPALPDDVAHAGRRTIANTLGLAVGACDAPATRVVLDAARSFEPPEQAGVLGRTERLNVEWTALVDGLAAHLEDFDDTHLATVIHPGAAVVPAALAVAEWLDSDGQRLLEATVVGVEVALRVGLGLSSSHFDRGWHISGTCGHVGAAAAAGLLLGLTAEQQASALSLAATQASGLLAALGTMTKPLHLGKAAANGVEAALLVAHGFTAPERGIEGRRGLARLASRDPDFTTMVSGLGQHWEACANAFKPYACGIVAHPAIDAAIELGRQVDPDALDVIVARVNPVVLDVMGVRDPTHGLQSKFSVYHAVAVGLRDGTAGPAQFTDAQATDPQIRALRERVRVNLDAGVGRDEAWLSARDRAGTAHEVHVPHASGSADRPLTDAQLCDKVTSLAAPVLGEARALALWECALSLSAAVPVRDLVAAARPDD